MTKDALGDRMKYYEHVETSRRCDRTQPICIRVDGRSFSRYTRGLKRPFDPRFSEVMLQTAIYLTEQTHATIGYTQSDEISLVIAPPSDNAEVLFGGRLHKLTSVVASLASAKFNSLIGKLLQSHAGKLASFDARAFQVPNMTEAANVILWRWLDARKNSVSMLAQSMFSHRELHGKNRHDLIEMMSADGTSWDNMPNHFKWGTVVRRQVSTRPLTESELLAIPECRRPVGPVVRSKVIAVDLPPLVDIENLSDALFRSAELSIRCTTSP